MLKYQFWIFDGFRGQSIKKCASDKRDTLIKLTIDRNSISNKILKKKTTNTFNKMNIIT